MVAEVSHLCRKGGPGRASLLQKAGFGVWLLVPLSEGHLCSLPLPVLPPPFPRGCWDQLNILSRAILRGEEGGLKLVGEPDHCLLSGSHRPFPHPCFQVAKETTQPIRNFGFVPVQPRKLRKANSVGVPPGPKLVGKERPLRLEASCRDALPHSCARTHARAHARARSQAPAAPTHLSSNRRAGRT